MNPQDVNIATEAFYQTINSPIMKALLGYLLAQILALLSTIAYFYCFKFKRIEKDSFSQQFDKNHKFFVYAYCGILFLAYQVYFGGY